MTKPGLFWTLPDCSQCLASAPTSFQRARVWTWVIGQPGIREESIYSELLIPGCPVNHVHARVLAAEE